MNRVGAGQAQQEQQARLPNLPPKLFSTQTSLSPFPSFPLMGAACPGPASMLCSVSLQPKNPGHKRAGAEEDRRTSLRSCPRWDGLTRADHSVKVLELDFNSQVKLDAHFSAR